MHIRSQKDFYSGLLLTALGLGFGWGATNLRMGTSAHMGPGYFPLLCSVLLTVIGIALCIKALAVRTADGDPIGRWALRPLVAIVLANMLFGILLVGWPALHVPAFGFVLATIVLVAVAAGASRQSRWLEVTLLALVLALGGWLVFVKGLEMPLPGWPSLMAW